MCFRRVYYCRDMLAVETCKNSELLQILQIREKEHGPPPAELWGMVVVHMVTKLAQDTG